jgi:hypothetical protein
MAENPDTRPGEGAVISVSDVQHAPFIFYELAPMFRFADGIVNITLSATRGQIGPSGTVVDEQVVVAYLRSNIAAVINLRLAIDKALLLAAPTQEGKAN